MAIPGLNLERNSTTLFEINKMKVFQSIDKKFQYLLKYIIFTPYYILSKSNYQ